MPFKDRYGPNEAKRLYKDAEQIRSHGQQETVELTNQLNGQIEVMTNNSEAINRNHIFQLNDWMSASDKVLKDNAHFRKTLMNFVQDDLIKVARAEMDQKLKEGIRDEQTSPEASNVDVLKREKERSKTTKGGDKLQASTPSASLDNSSNQPTLSPINGTVTGSVSTSTGDIVTQQSSTPPSITEQALVAESNNSAAKTTIVSSIPDRVQARTAKLQSGGLFSGSYNRGVARSAYASQVHNIETPINAAFENDSRRVRINLASGKTWEGAINSVSMDDPIEVRESLVDFLKREQLTNIGVNEGLSTSFVVDKLLPIAQEKIKKMNERYRNAWLVNDATNQKKGALADLRATAELGTENPETLVDLVNNTLVQIQDANKDLQLAGIANNAGKTSLQEFSDGIESITEVLYRNGQVDEITKLHSAVAVTRAKFPWLGKKQGADGEGKVLLGKADKRFTINGLKTMLHGIEKKVYNEREEAKTIRADNLLEAYRKARITGDNVGMLNARMEMKNSGLHIDRKSIYEKMTNTTGTLLTGTAAEGVVRQELEVYGVVTHKTIESIEPETWVTLLPTLKKEGILKDEQIVEFKYGENPIYEDNRKLAAKTIHSFFASKEGLKLASELGSATYNTAYADALKEIPIWAIKAREARTGRQAIPGNEGTDIEEGARMFLATLVENQEKYDNAKRNGEKPVQEKYVWDRDTGFGYHDFENSDIKRVLENASISNQIFDKAKIHVKDNPAVLLNLGFLPEDFYKATSIRNQQGDFLNPAWYKLASLSNGRYTALTLARANALRSGNTLEYNGNIENAETLEKLLRTRKDGSLIVELPQPGTKAMDRRVEYGLGYISLKSQGNVYTTHGAGFGGSGVNFGKLFSRKITNEEKAKGYRTILDVNQQLESQNISNEERTNRACLSALAETQGIREITGNWKTGDGFGLKGDRDVNGRPIVFGNYEIAIGYNSANKAYQAATGQKFNVLSSSKSASNIKHTGAENGSLYVKGEAMDVGPETKAWLTANDPQGERFGWVQHVIPDPQNPGQYLYNHFRWVGQKGFNPAHNCKIGI